MFYGFIVFVYKFFFNKTWSMCINQFIVSLSVVKKKNKVEHKQKHYEQIQESIDHFKHVFVVRPHNMRNTQLQQLRERFGESKYVPFTHTLV